MATNTYTYGSLGERWAVGEPTSKDRLDLARNKADANRWTLTQLLDDADDSPFALADGTTATTQGSSDNSTKIATTAWVTANAITNPAGSNTQIQYNNSGAFGASGNLTFDGSTLNVTGNAGVGIARTAGTLHVRTSSSGSPSYSAAGDDLIIENSADVGMSIIGGSSGEVQIHMGDAAAASNGLVGYSNTSNYMYFHTNNAERMRIDTNGVVGVGQAPTNTTRIMQVKGAVSFGRGNSASSGAANMLSGFTGTLVADNSARSLLQSIGGAGVFAIVCGYTGDSNHSFMDVVASATGSFAVISSTTIEGSPGARTYSYASESLKVAINDSSTTYYVSVNALGTNEMANSTTPTIGA